MKQIQQETLVGKHTVDLETGERGRLGNSLVLVEAIVAECTKY